MRYVCLILFVALCGCLKKTTPLKPPVRVEVVKPTVKNTYLYNTYVGKVQPSVQVEVRAQVEGVLNGYYFKEGREVKKGELIFEIDARPYEAELAKATAGLAESLANLRYAEDVAKRNARLVQKDYVSKLQYDEYITNVMTSKAEIKKYEADIETAKINISYCNIHAPMDAITGVLQINVGNLIQNAGQTPLVTLNQITPTYVYFSVPQKDLSHIMKLHREKPLCVKSFLDSDFKTPFTGTLDLINNEVDNTTGSIWLRGIFPNREKLLWPGGFVDVRLLLEKKDNAILVPTVAVAQGQKGKYVFIITDEEKAKMKMVTTGQTFGDMTLIEKGVKPTDRLVTKGQINLSTGTKVEIKQ